MSAPPSSPGRPYDATGRRAAAEQRRTHVARTAAEMFVERGWTGTRLRDVSRRAGVSDELLHRAFGSKAHLLLAALRVTAFREPDLSADAATLQLAALPPAGRLPALVDYAVATLPRVAPFVPVLHTAAAEDATARELLDAVRRQRRSTAEALARDLGSPGSADVLYVLTSAETWLQFTSEVGWSAEQYGRWLLAALQDEIARASGGRPRRARPS